MRSIDWKKREVCCTPDGHLDVFVYHACLLFLGSIRGLEREDKRELVSFYLFRLVSSLGLHQADKQLNLRRFLRKSEEINSQKNSVQNNRSKEE